MRLPSSCAREATSSPSAENASEVSTQSNPSSSSDPRNGTPKTSRAKPTNTTTSITSIASRDRINEARYCQRGIGEATSRFSSFFCRASTIEKPMPQIAEPIRFMPSRPGTTKSM